MKRSIDSELNNKEIESFRALSDEELITLYREGDQGAIEFLMDKYKGLVRSKAHSMYILGGDSDDLIQEGMLGLFKAVRDYDSGRDASFRTFAQLCVTRQLYTAVTASGRKKHLPLNTAISLSQTTQNSGDEDGDSKEEALVNHLEADASSNPEDYLIDRENLSDLEEKIDRELSSFEREVLDLHLTGMGYVEIAHVLNRDEKSTDNALQRIRAKIRKML